jgi:NADH-quinone oxidoreductase subunit N
VNAGLESIREAVNYVVPELVLVAAACVLFLLAAFRGGRHVAGGVAALAFLIALPLWFFDEPTARSFAGGLFRHDQLAWFTKGLGILGGLALVCMSWNQIGERLAAEYHACLLVVMAGTGLVGAASDLVSLFLALEMVSIPTYVLLYLPRFNRQAQEASTKYFLLSVFSSALLLYGFSFLYGTFGTTNLDSLRTAFQQADAAALPATLSVALVMILAGLGFRIAAAPFHFYAPDVYQGTATIGAALLAYVPKVVGFVALIQMLITMLWERGLDLRIGALGLQAGGLIWILAIASMCVGNLLGLLQNNLRRLLAYSSIAHAGYMLAGLGAGAPAGATPTGMESVLFYLAVYGAMTIGAFTIITYLSRPERPIETIDDLAGLGRSHPLPALLMTVFLFSLTGLPPTAGFWAKLHIFFAAWGTHTQLYRILAIAMALNAALGAWYYLKIVSAMYLRQSVKELDQPTDRAGFTGIVLCGVLTLLLFFFPGMLWKSVHKVVSKEPVAQAQAPSSVLARRE